MTSRHQKKTSDLLLFQHRAKWHIRFERQQQHTCSVLLCFRLLFIVSKPLYFFFVFDVTKVRRSPLLHNPICMAFFYHIYGIEANCFIIIGYHSSNYKHYQRGKRGISSLCLKPLPPTSHRCFGILFHLTRIFIGQTESLHCDTTPYQNSFLFHSFALGLFFYQLYFCL